MASLSLLRSPAHSRISHQQLSFITTRSLICARPQHRSASSSSSSPQRQRRIMASADILSKTLSSITTIKLEQLQKQKTDYENRKTTLLASVEKETDARKRAETLLKGVKDLPSAAKNSLDSLENLKRFIEQAEHDPSISEAFLKDYEKGLRNGLDVQSNKYEFASLYGKLVNEWTSAGKRKDAAAGEEFVPVGREEMHEQRATWEEYVFKAKETDPEAIKTYLKGIFIDGDKDVKLGYDWLKKHMEDFQKGFAKETHFYDEVVAHCLRGMLRGDNLTDEKRATLKDFLGNEVVLNEIADVLNMRMTTRSTWCWDTPLVIEQRRSLNGRYRFYAEEDLLHSIFIYYIGRRFAVTLRSALGVFIGMNGVWKPNTKPISKVDRRRRQYFLNESSHVREADTVEGIRKEHFHDQIFLDQLPVSMDEQRGAYGDDGSEREHDTRKGHVQVIQELLHKIETEIILRRKLGQDTVVIRSDFKWFGPSIPHSSIFAVLEFFGVNQEWLGFFKRVLEAPLKFKQDPADATPQIRKRGTPLSTPLADFFGEALLFCLDFGVNQKADGALLYRLHDDMWLWGETEACEAGWKAMVEFASVVGLDFNTDKTGCAVILPDNAAPDKAAVIKTTSNPNSLPQGAVSWGFLKLDPKTGHFLIDQKEVDKHIAELKLQLDACKTVFDWIQAWNVYGVRFFTNNFGQPAHCYGKAHVDSMLATFRRIQLALFPGGNAGEHLKSIIASRFGVTDLPGGYLYFPVSMGGLGLQNPFVGLSLISVQKDDKPDEEFVNPDKRVEKFLELEGAEYRRAKKRFEERTDEDWLIGSEWDDLRNEPFMSYEEFVRYRERTSALLWETYVKLVALPAEVDVEFAGMVRAALKGWHEWTALSSYEKWIVQLYCGDMIARFGGLEIVDRGLLPMGLMGMLRESRFKWQG